MFQKLGSAFNACIINCKPKPVKLSLFCFFVSSQIRLPGFKTLERDYPLIIEHFAAFNFFLFSFFFFRFLSFSFSFRVNFCHVGKRMGLLGIRCWYTDIQGRKFINIGGLPLTKAVTYKCQHTFWWNKNTSKCNVVVFSCHWVENSLLRGQENAVSACNYEVSFDDLDCSTSSGKKTQLAL